jgi:CBS domain-containing protein
MKLKEIMTEEVEVVKPDATLYEAANKMRNLDVGALPVCDGDRLVGMLTDRDMTVRAVADGLDPKKALVRDSMTPEMAWCFEDQTATEAEHLMAEKQIRRLPVLNRDKRLVGIISLGDLATKTTGMRAVGKTLEAVSEPGRGGRTLFPASCLAAP